MRETSKYQWILLLVEVMIIAIAVTTFLLIDYYTRDIFFEYQGKQEYYNTEILKRLDKIESRSNSSK
jgi:hypothetical protein